MNHTAAPQPTRSRVLSLLWFPFFFAAAMSVLNLLAFAHPEPHDLRLGVIGAAPALPAGFTVDQVTDASGVAANDLAGVYDSATRTLYVAPAASGTRANYLTAVLHPAYTVDVVPLAHGDVSGVGVFFYGLPLLLVGMITSIVLLQFAMWPIRKKVVVIAATGAFATVVTFVTAVALDVVPADPWLLIYGLLLTQAIGWLTTALPRLVKQFFMPAAMTFVLILGIPTSGATVNADLLPPPLAWLHQVLPFGQFVEAVRATAYFHGHGLVRPLAVLIAWAVGAAALLAWASRPARPIPAPAGPPVGPANQRVHGVVRSTAGLPVADATVLVLDDAGNELVRTTTGADGRYAAGGIRSGLHHLVVTAAHHEPEVVSIGIRANRQEPPRDITLIDWNDPAANLTAEEILDRRTLMTGASGHPQ